MICPACGHDNSDNATRCSVCGADLTQQADRGGTQPLPPGREPEQAPPPRDVTWKEFLSLQARKATTFLHRHQRAVAVAAVIALAALLAVILVARALASAPTNAALEADLAQRAGSTTYVAGQYGSDEELSVSSVSVTKKTQTQSPTVQSNALDAPAYEVEAEVHYQNGSVEVVRNVGGTYVRGDGGWVLAGELADLGTSYTARSGVDQEKVLANAAAIMAQADASWTGEGSLASAYQDATFSVVGSDFQASPQNDTSTDDVTLHAVRAGTFSSIQTDVTAHFAFLDGTWQLRSAEASDGALAPVYDQLKGTWLGTHTGSRSTAGTCYGANSTPLSVTIASVGDSSGSRSQVTGTISGLAHFHAPAKTSEDSDEGDQELRDVAFTGTISTAHDDQTNADLNIACKVPDSAGGSLAFTLGFGPKDDPTGAVAIVSTTHEYTERLLFVVPYQTQVTYTDTYSLSRAAAE